MKIPRLREDLCVREIDGEAVILDRENERMHSFNATAACILQAMDGNRSDREISEILTSRFEVSLEIALNDTRQVIEELEKLGLLATPESE